MIELLLAFLLGCVSGLRSLTAPAVVCWAAHLGWLHLEETRLAFLGHAPARVLFTVLALLELIADKLPSTPARTAPVGLIARIVLGGVSGAALAANVGASLLVAAGLGAIGGVVGAFAGYNVRHALVSRMHLPAFAVALAEDIIAIVGAVLIVRRA